VSVDRLLAEARSGLPRLKPHEAAEAVRAGGFLVDTRPEYQRRADGDERIHWIVPCDEGYSSSLAAARLLRPQMTATAVIRPTVICVAPRRIAEGSSFSLPISPATSTLSR
jgi:hypothetical protein